MLSTVLILILLHHGDTLNRSQYAVDWLITAEYQIEQARLGVDWGEHPGASSNGFRAELAIGVYRASLATGLDPELIAAIAWRESRFDQRVIDGEKLGKVGERGLMQVHGVAARGCELLSVAKQLDCGARWLRRQIDKCGGDVVGGIARYMSGYTCEPTGGFRRTCKSRYYLYQRIKR
jgi:hypothetical protein